MPRKKKDDPDPWGKSEAKRLLLYDLRHGVIPLDSSSMAPRDAYLQRPEFCVTGYKNFPSRLRSAREQTKLKNSRCVSDSAAFAHDRRIYPKPATNHRGEPRWEGSETERLLREDMDNFKHKTLKPKLLYKSRKEYHEKYPLPIFREHIYQEEKRRKFLTQYGARYKNKY
jgi:hypothetical protein